MCLGGGAWWLCVGTKGLVWLCTVYFLSGSGFLATSNTCIFICGWLSNCQVCTFCDHLRCMHLCLIQLWCSRRGGTAAGYFHFNGGSLERHRRGLFKSLSRHAEDTTCTGTTEEHCASAISAPPLDIFWSSLLWSQAFDVRNLIYYCMHTYSNAWKIATHTDKSTTSRWF